MPRFTIHTFRMVPCLDCHREGFVHFWLIINGNTIEVSND